MDSGLNQAVKNNDNAFPPEWRLSRSDVDAHLQGDAHIFRRRP